MKLRERETAGEINLRVSQGGKTVPKDIIVREELREEELINCGHESTDKYAEFVCPIVNRGYNINCSECVSKMLWDRWR